MPSEAELKARLGEYCRVRACNKILREARRTLAAKEVFPEPLADGVSIAPGVCSAESRNNKHREQRLRVHRDTGIELQHQGDLA